MPETLKPCPCCGGRMWTRRFTYPNGYTARQVMPYEIASGCYVCSNVPPVEDDNWQEFVAAWNRRATTPDTTCRMDETETYECVRDDMGGYGKRLIVHVMECGECGRTYEHVNGDYEFCPHCGKKVVE